MSGKSSFTSRERIAMIVVAGLVAIAIAALALQKRNSVPVAADAPSAQTSRLHTVKDCSDSTATVKKSKKRREKAQKKQKAKPAPKPRDYFTSPENE